MAKAVERLNTDPEGSEDHEDTTREVMHLEEKIKDMVRTMNEMGEQIQRYRDEDKRGVNHEVEHWKRKQSTIETRINKLTAKITQLQRETGGENPLKGRSAKDAAHELKRLKRKLGCAEKKSAKLEGWIKAGHKPEHKSARKMDRVTRKLRRHQKTITRLKKRMSRMRDEMKDLTDGEERNDAKDEMKHLEHLLKRKENKLQELNKKTQRPATTAGQAMKQESLQDKTEMVQAMTDVDRNMIRIKKTMSMIWPILLLSLISWFLLCCCRPSRIKDTSEDITNQIAKGRQAAEYMLGSKESSRWQV